MHANAWSLDKDRSIKCLLITLNQRLGEQAYAISERQQDDFRAIHLHKADDEATVAYVFTYGQEEERYGLHLEYPTLPEQPVPLLPEIYENLDIERVIEALAIHFEAYGA